MPVRKYLSAEAAPQHIDLAVVSACVNEIEGRQMSELDKLKKENKKLKALLKIAVELLHKSRDVLTHATAPRAKKPRAKSKQLKSKK
jgi:hypothetical protein